MDFNERSPIEIGFARVFQRDVKPNLLALEATRQRLLSQTIWLLLACACATVATITALVLWVDMVQPMAAIALPALLGIIGGVRLVTFQSKRWTASVNTALMPAICAHVGDITYSENGNGFSLRPLDDLQLLPNFTHSELTSRLSGTHNGVAFDLVHARLRKSSRRRMTAQTVFQGILLRSDVQTPAPGRIVFLPERGHLGNMLAESFSFGGTRAMSKLDFDHPAFERQYEVYADRPSEAYGYVPPQLLSSLLDISHLHGTGRGSNSLLAGYDYGAFYMALRRPSTFLRAGGLRTPVGDMVLEIHEVFDDIARVQDILDRLQGT